MAVIAAPVAGIHYPRSLGELRSWFVTDADCLDYLEWLRWPNGFVCPRCGQLGGWRLGDDRFRCAACRSCTSVTAGTIFDRTRTPLTVWFMAAWLFATQKDGVSAQSVQRALEIGSYQTAWAMLHRLRSVLVRPGRERLTGIVEVDETFIGGEEPGLRGGRARGKKSLVGIAVEVKEPRGLGRCRMAIIDDASAASLHPFVTANIEPGASVITDAWQGYAGINDLGYVRDRRSQRAARLRGDDPFALLPNVHRVASLAKRWLLGTHQGSVDEAHLQSYLDEFVFRFNRRTSRSRGLRVPPRAPARRRPRTRPLPRPHRQRHAEEAPADWWRLGSPTQPRPPSSRPAVESCLTWTGPLKWIPPTARMPVSIIPTPKASFQHPSSRAVRALPNPYSRFVAQMMTVSPGQSWNRPAGDTSVSSVRSSATNASRRSAKRSGAAKDMDR